MKQQLLSAAREYIKRRDRITHPAGSTDNGGRWFPLESESRPCCDHIRAPSRAFPWSLSHHCRTMPHVAALYNVDVKALRKAVREIEA